MKQAVATIVTLGALALSVAAQGHISLHPNAIPAGAFATLDIRVPGEQEKAHVQKVDVLFPPGFTSVAYENVPGWSVKVVNRKLARPVQTDDGPVSQEVAQIVWSWTGPLGRVDNDQFVDFPLSVAIPDDLAGRSLQFKALQTYSDGQEVRWIDPSLQDEHPAPTINITKQGGAIEDLAGEEAGPTPGQLATSTPVTVAKASSGASKSLGVAALVLGALGLLIGLFALIMLVGSRRMRSSAAS
jgi:periplasmic copper chaperone A